MGKMTRIVLLSVTAALAVFTFSAMWVVRPDSQSSVLDAARERQNEPLLSVSEPLETDTSSVDTDEEMARRIAEMLAADEGFVSSIGEKLDGTLSPDYSGLEDEIITLYEKYRSEIADDMILAVLNGYNTLSVEDKSVTLDLVSQLEAIYSEYRDAIIADIAAEIPGGLSNAEIAAVVTAVLSEQGFTAENAEAFIKEVYEKYREAVVSDVENGIIEDYSALDDVGKATVLSLEDIYSEYRDAIAADLLSGIITEDDVRALAEELYSNNREAIVNDIIAGILTQYNALDEGEKAAVLSLEDIYAYYRDAIVSDILSEADKGLTADDVKALAAELYEENKEAVVADIEQAIIDDYNALSDEEKAELLALPEEDLREEAIALYNEYRDEIISDVAASIPAESSTSEVAKPQKTPIAKPTFVEGGLIDPNASAEEYAEARSSLRASEIDKALSFIN
ncbi:MAG: hypothetical protein IAA97_00430 [Spirochaetes bacterium]|uniref:Uncharacterized protein n=1 Tax=Candidatus Ornithospirochaeta stercoripullorum TaxID=2840899 RepID=A0A9D9DWG0_9SPIO|nr:hypothetical protein [Candidatus Ornithospirochaeta stercoripullorum]